MAIDVRVLSDNWAITGVFASFLVAVVALYLGWRANNQVNKVRREDKKERILTETIQWAINLRKTVMNIGPDHISGDERKEALARAYTKMDRALTGSSVEDVYIKAIVSKVFSNSELERTVNIAVEYLEKLRLSVGYKDKDKDKAEVADKDLKDFIDKHGGMDACFEAVINKATDIIKNL